MTRASRRSNDSPANFQLGLQVKGGKDAARRPVDHGQALKGFFALEHSDQTIEAYLSCFSFDREMLDYLKARGTVKGYAGPTWAPYVRFDIDDSKLDTALASSRRLVTHLVRQNSRLDDQSRSNLLVVDYIQRIRSRRLGRDNSPRTSLDENIASLRRLALQDNATVLVLSSVSRSRDSRGRSTYSGLSIASLKESSELEFASDVVVLLQPPANELGNHPLSCVKSRYGETFNAQLTFNGAHQFLRSADWLPAEPAPRQTSEDLVRERMAPLWRNTPGCTPGGLVNGQI